MYEIEKGIKLPEPIIPGRPASKYPWRKMNIGDSFFVPVNEVKLSSLYTMASHAGGYHNKKFTVRKVTDGFRVWRTK